MVGLIVNIHWRYKQSGAVILMVAGFMFLAVSFLALSVDTGRLYLEKRNLQRLADTAALEAAKHSTTCATAITTARASTARHQFVHGQNNQVVTVTCGTLGVTSGIRSMVEDVNNAAVIRVVVSESVPASLIMGGIFGNDIVISAEAMASKKGSPLASLTIRSTLLGVSVTNNPEADRLNAMLSGLLGGNVNLSVGAWNGLLHTDINLFQYLSALAVNLGLSAGEVDQVLQANVSAGQLIQAAIDVIETQTGSPQTTVNALNAIVAMDAINVAAATSPTTLKLHRLLSLDPDGDYTGAVMNLQLFQLVQGIIQLANRENAAVANVPISVPGVGNVDLRLKVIEPPIFSAIADPNKALSGQTAPIRVRTAQVRLLVSVSLNSALSTLVTGLNTAVNNIVSPIVSLLNSLLTLNLVNLVDSLLCVISCTRDVADPLVVPAPFRFDVNIDVGAAQAEVTAFTCGSGDNRTLTVPVTTSAVTVRMGRMGSSAAAAATHVFSSSMAPTVEPVPLVDFGMRRRTCVLIIGCSNSSRFPFYGGGIGLREDLSLLGTQQTLNYVSPNTSELPEVHQPPKFQSVSTQSSIVTNIANSLHSPAMYFYTPTGSASITSTVLSGSQAVITTLVDLLRTAVRTVLSPLLNPIIDRLFMTAGIDLAKADVGANLSCSSETGVELIR
jgi:uncharacterized membrane protein